MISTLVGYAGGREPDPTYRSMGDHTESLLVVFDPLVVSYEQLLETFWAAHDPCRKTGWRQYRNVVFYLDPTQQAKLLAAKAALERRRGQSVATAIEPAGIFTPAEDYHQKYTLRQHRRIHQALRALYPGEADFQTSTAAARINGYLAGFGAAAHLQGELDRLGLDGEAREELLRAAANLVR